MWKLCERESFHVSHFRYSPDLSIAGGISEPLSVVVNLTFFQCRILYNFLNDFKSRQLVVRRREVDKVEQDALKLKSLY